MKRRLEPTWSAEEHQAGERMREAWEEYFSAREGQVSEVSRRPSMRPEDAHIIEVKARHEAELLRYPNVVGVSTGMRTRHGVPGDEPCLVVYVERKLPPDRLGAGEQLPSELEGVPVDVVESGRFRTLPK